MAEFVQLSGDDDLRRMAELLEDAEVVSLLEEIFEGEPTEQASRALEETKPLSLDETGTDFHTGPAGPPPK